MASQSTAAGDALVRVRRERVHTTMLIELLVLLVFLALAFAFVRDNEKRFDTLQDKLRQQEQELEAANAEIRRLGAVNNQLLEENESLQRSLRRFMAAPDGTLPANERLVLVRASTFQEQAARLDEAERIIGERQEENSMLRRRLQSRGQGGSDLPPCTVASGRFIAAIDLLPGGGFQVQPRWTAQANSQVARVPGLVELASGRVMGEGEFRSLSSKVQDWGRAQPTPCGFYVEVYSRHSNLNLYKDQYLAVGAHFYPAMR